MMTERVDDARREMTDLRKVVGKMGVTAAEKARQGQIRALQYLDAELAVVRGYDDTLLAAVLAAVGPAYFKVNAAGKRLLADALDSEADEDVDDGDAEDDSADGSGDEDRIFDDVDGDDEGDDEAEELDERDAPGEMRFPDGLWERLASQLTLSGDAQRIIVALAETDCNFLLRSVAIAVQLMSSDSLRKHL